MCYTNIYTWHNGKGNHILQIINTIYYTYYHNFNISFFKFPGHEYFSLNDSSFPEKLEGCYCDKKIDITRKINPCCDNFLLSLEDMKNLFQKHVTFKKELPKKEKYDIGIHIRSGDIFGRNVHWEYVQPPLDYYIQFIEHNKEKSIIFVYENNKNPVIDKIIEYVKEKKFENIHFQSSSVLEDIITLSLCKYLVFSMGTFCLLPYLISPFIKKVFITSFMINKPRGKNWYKINENENNILIVFEQYMKAGAWKKKPEQVDLMLNYKIDRSQYSKFKID